MLYLYLVSWDSSDASTGTTSQDRNVKGSAPRRRRARAGGCGHGWGWGSGRGSVWVGGRYWAESGYGGTRLMTGGSHPGGGGNLNI